MFCVFPPRRPLPHLGERGCKAREVVAAGGLAGHVPGTRGKVDDMHPTTVGPARSLEPPLATRNVGQCHRHLAPLLSSTGWSTPLTTSHGHCLSLCAYVSLYVRTDVCTSRVRYILAIIPTEIQYHRQPQKEKPGRPGRAVAFLPDGGMRAGVLAEGSPTTPKACAGSQSQPTHLSTLPSYIP